MNIKKYIPNLFTLGNLFCGTLATIFAAQYQFEAAALFVVLGIVFDFFDGFLARILGVSGELGKQLDSLADMVTSGVVPGIVMFQLLNESIIIKAQNSIADIDVNLEGLISLGSGYWPYIGLILTLAACYRLAKFNLDTRQSESFIGMPTPAMSLFVVALPLILVNTEIEFVKEMISNNYFLIGVTLVLSFLMNAEIPLFSLKFKNFGLKENVFKYLLIAISIVLLITTQYLAIPLIIVIYLLLSVINNMMTKKGKA
ncbi:MAG: CDP-alcohol phosphatidyltransferase family protein [Flavobacteriaceae bacterium]